MGGMAVLEWPLCTELGFVRHIIPIATSARHSAWCISWGEAQRQSIYSDPTYEDGYYPEGTQPQSGLAAARMAALLTYRSRDSFESRFGRNPQRSKEKAMITPPGSPCNSKDEVVAAHNDGLRNYKRHSMAETNGRPLNGNATTPKPPIFSAQSYLRYQGDKFTARFDANCYIHITRKMDTHDIARERQELSSPEDESLSIARTLARLPPRALVIGVQSDGLFLLAEQRELAESIPDAELAIINSPDGHDGFLLEFEQINAHILRFLRREHPELYRAGDDKPTNGFEIKKTSMFGEAEVDVTRW